MVTQVDSDNDEHLLSTGDMARLTGNTLRTVRFYEEAGILRPERRSTGGHRLFSKRELERLQLISDLRATGLALDEIRALLEVKDRGTTAISASTAVVKAVELQLATLDERIAVLTRLRGELGRVRTVLEHCFSCTDSAFPQGCEGCEQLSSKGELPTSVRVLWGLGGTPAG